jgi:hypothetical protein
MHKNQKGVGAPGVLLSLLLFAIIGYIGWYVYSSQNNAISTYDQTVGTQTKPPEYKKIVAAGDVACDPNDAYFSKPDSTHCESTATASIIEKLKPDAILALGDLQYENGALDKFRQSYDASWGKYKDITYPIPGNHEYNTPNASGYFSYFNDGKNDGRAGKATEGFYSTDIGLWHVVALNSNCAYIDGCNQGSPQYEWLQKDLDASKKDCTVAFWHHPHFTSGKYAADKANADLSTDFWNLLLLHKADVVLNGHDHLYERFAAQTTDGKSANNGIRQFTVGIGGKSQYHKSSNSINSQKVIDDKFGVLSLELYTKAYQWQFVDTSGKILDKGVGQCVI